MPRRYCWLLLFLVIPLTLTGCQGKETDGDSPTPAAGISPTSAPDNRTPTLAPGETGPKITKTPSGGLFPTTPISLTFWTVDSFAPSNLTPGGRSILDQLEAFDESHPEANVDIVIKRVTGPGSIEDYLRIASQVAPTVLPDVAVLSSDLLPQMVGIPVPSEGEMVVQPLNDLLPPEVISDLLPISMQLGSMNDRLMGIPFMLDFEHLVYNTAILTETQPTTWDIILASGGPYLLPAGENAPVDPTLSQYLAAGGSLTNSKGVIQLEIDPLTEVFRFYQKARTDRVIPNSAIQTHSLAESWKGYRSGSALIGHVNASTYLPERSVLLNTGVSPLPGPDKPAKSLVYGWVWVITTADPGRQQLAAELIAWLMMDEHLGDWSIASQWLPSTEGAFTAWPDDDEYIQFAREQLQIGIPRPDLTYYELIHQRLAQGVYNVISLTTSPAAAASYSAP